MAQSVKSLVLPQSTQVLKTTRQSVPSGPPARRRLVVSPTGGVTQAQPPFTDAVPAGQVTSSLTVRWSPPPPGGQRRCRSQSATACACVFLPRPSPTRCNRQAGRNRYKQPLADPDDPDAWVVEARGPAASPGRPPSRSPARTTSANLGRPVAARRR